jgi:triosephosphate isomerase
MRRPFLAGNWKMYKTLPEALELVAGLKRELLDIKDKEIAVFPPYPILHTVARDLKNSNIGVGAQNLFWEEQGAFTGEISAKMLIDVGCKYVIIGHSERRQYFGETNETVNKKIFAALKAGLLPIVCVGEKLEEREAGKTFKVIEEHIKNGLKGLTSDQMSKVTIAYEPVWAIGTGKTATKEHAQEVHAFIRKLLAEMFGKEVSDKVRIQYGGSVKPENIKELMSQPDIDGVLVGGASLKVDSFVKIVRF